MCVEGVNDHSIELRLIDTLRTMSTGMVCQQELYICSSIFMTIYDLMEKKYFSGFYLKNTVSHIYVEIESARLTKNPGQYQGAKWGCQRCNYSFQKAEGIS